MGGSTHHVGGLCIIRGGVSTRAEELNYRVICPVSYYRPPLHQAWLSSCPFFITISPHKCLITVGVLSTAPCDPTWTETKHPISEATQSPSPCIEEARTCLCSVVHGVHARSTLQPPGSSYGARGSIIRCRGGYCMMWGSLSSPPGSCRDPENLAPFPPDL